MGFIITFDYLWRVPISICCYKALLAKMPSPHGCKMMIHDLQHAGQRQVSLTRRLYKTSHGLRVIISIHSSPLTPFLACISIIQINVARLSFVEPSLHDQ